MFELFAHLIIYNLIGVCPLCNIIPVPGFYDIDPHKDSPCITCSLGDDVDAAYDIGYSYVYNWG